MNSLIAYEALLPRLDSAYLDCVTCNAALLLLHAGQGDVRTPFAYQWYFAFEENLPQAQPLLGKTSFIEAVDIWTGYRIQQARLSISNCLDVLRAFIKRGQPVLVFGDAFCMPWLPYYGHEHLEHSFIVDGIDEDEQLIHIVDAYENVTEWGHAQPVACELAAATLPDMLNREGAYAGTLLFVEKKQKGADRSIKAALLENAQQMIAAHQRQRLHTFARYYQALMPDSSAAKRFTLALWLIARVRALHGCWLDDIAEQQPALLPSLYAQHYQEQVVIPWKRASEQAYLLQRRILRGHKAPEACFSMLEEVIAAQELALAEELLHHLEALG